MINLILAFSVSVKHLLRGEKGVYYEDLFSLISFLPKFANGNPNKSEKLPLWHDSEDEFFDDQPVSTPATELGRDQIPEMALLQVEAMRPLKPARNPPRTMSLLDFIPFFMFFKSVVHKLFRARRPSKSKYTRSYTHFDSECKNDIPLEIIHVLSNYSAWCMENGLLNPAIATGLTTNLTSLQDALSNLVGVCNSPLPFGYQVHLRMSVWLYLLFLPFQILNALSYVTIPATAFTAFLLLGILEICQGIENPFDYGLNDLDLDRFCYTIQRELHLITAHTNPKPSDFIFTSWNQPFAPADRRNAQELTQSDTAYHLSVEGVEPGLPSIRHTLVKGWKDVDSIVRF